MPLIRPIAGNHAAHGTVGACRYRIAAARLSGVIQRSSRIAPWVLAALIVLLGYSLLNLGGTGGDRSKLVEVGPGLSLPTGPDPGLQATQEFDYPLPH